VWKNTFYFLDYTGKVAETNVYLAAPPSFEVLDGAVSAISDVLSGISDAYLQKGLSFRKFSPTTPQVVKGPGSSYDRLILLCTDGTNYASVTIPAPAQQPYFLVGPFAGFKVDKSPPNDVSSLEALVTMLDLCVTPVGLPFPTEDWQAALMVPQV
jgi:hypothetical protein